MQLSSIALATIFIALFATGPVTSSSVSEARAMFQKLAREAEASKGAQSGPNGRKQPLTEPKPATASTKTASSSTARSTVRFYPPPSSHPKSTGGSPTKPSPGPTVKPTATLPSKSTPPPKTSASKQQQQPSKSVTPPQPVIERPEPEPLILPPGPPKVTPNELRKQQESQRSTAKAHKTPQSTASGVSSVGDLTKMWERFTPSSQPTSGSSASPPKPTPRPAPHTSSKPSGAPPKATSIPGDTNFVRFKEAIKQGNLFYAAMIDAICGILSDPSPSTLKSYGEFLAGLDVPKILSIFDDSAQEPDESELHRWTQELIIAGPFDQETICSRMKNIDPERVTLLTSGLFLVYASDDKFSKLLEGLGELDPNFKKDALSFSVAYSITFSPGSLPRLFKVFTEEDQAKTLDEVANEMFKSGEPEAFDALIAELQRGNALDKDSENFAFNIAFGLACKNNDLVLAQKYYGSARIFSSTYGKAILDSYDDKRSKNEVFDWLLKNAGRDALFGLEYQAPEEIKATLKRAFEAVKYKFRTHSTKSP